MRQRRFSVKVPSLLGRAARTLAWVIRDTARQIVAAELPLVASSLAYTTLLSIIPALAVSFSLFKAFGGFEKVYGVVEPILVENLAASASAEALATIRKFINNAHAGAVGAGGFLGLMATTLLMFNGIERSINRVWGTRVERNWFQRVSSYWMFVSLGPIALGVFVGFAGSLVNAANTATGALTPLKGLAPSSSVMVALFSLTFVLVYKFVPSRFVSWGPAIIGGLTAGFTFNLARLSYRLYVKNVVTYNKLYGSLGAVPILLVWLYIVWLVVLSGAALAAALQKKVDERRVRPSGSGTAATALLLVLGSFLGGPRVADAAPAPASVRAGKESAVRTPAPSGAPRPQVLQDHWYTLSVGPGKVYGFLNERSERDADGRIQYRNHLWKHEEGYLNEESIGAIVRDDANLTPIAWNFTSNYRGSRLIIDGSAEVPAQGGPSMLSVLVRQDERELPRIRRSIQRNLTLSSLFPLLLARKIDVLPMGKPWSFGVIYEDDVARAFSSESGRVVRMQDDEFAKTTSTRKVRVDIRNTQGVWYLDSGGYALRIQTGGTDVVLDRVRDEKAARAALDASPLLRAAPAGGAATGESAKAARDAALDGVLYGQ